MKKDIKNTPHIIKGAQEINKKFKKQNFNCLTGMRPSGRLHLGHYTGALLNILQLQKLENININFLVADYQVLGDHLGEIQKLRDSVINMIIDCLSVGINPEKVNFVIQSYVPEFCELFNYLTMFTPFNVAINNPTLKDEMKKIKNREKKEQKSISLGFINYPVSQVADILLLQSEIIPVGEDQIPHIELARKIIKKVNVMYGTSFPIPSPFISQTPRLIGTDGNDKMSKSLGNTIYLTSTKEEIIFGVNSMYTDPKKISISSQGNIEKHVVFKYLDIFYEDKNHIEELKNRYIKGGDNSIGDGELKKLLIDVLEKIISPIRTKREYYKNHINDVVDIMEKGSEKARLDGQKLLYELKEKMGLLNYGKI